MRHRVQYVSAIDRQFIHTMYAHTHTHRHMGYIRVPCRQRHYVRQLVCIRQNYYCINKLALELVLCEYSKFRIESNSYFSIRLDSKRAQLFQIFEYLPSPISYLFNRMTPIFTRDSCTGRYC